jgi:hypothetical protein
MMPEQIPHSTHPFFQEYNPDDLLLDKDGDLIIERILALGNRKEIRWLFTRYGKEEIKRWVEVSGDSKLPRRRYNLFCVLFDSTPTSRRIEESKIWPY